MDASVTVHMDAPPEKVWALVSDVTQIGRFSPETFEAEWIDGSTGPVAGARFRGHVRRNEKGPVYWTTCTVLESEPNRKFSFYTGRTGDPLNTWSYELQPSNGGTDVTESFRLANTLPLRVYWALLGWARGKRNTNDMRRTLERIKAVVEETG
jgi:uncharacterized protein YndB with AHSA1/START domain